MKSPNMVKYAYINHVQWYICIDCGNKERKQYNYCPVCKNTERNPNKELRNVLDLFILKGGI